MTTFAQRTSSVARRATALACDVRGSGTPLLLIHTLAASGAMFAPLLPTLAAGRQLMLPDLRGHARSRCLGAPTGVDQFAADIATLLDLLGIARCAVLGYGYGGVVAMRLAAIAGARVERLVLACTPARSAATPLDRLATALTSGAAQLVGTAPLATRGNDADAQAARAARTPGDRTAIAAAARALVGADVRPWLPLIACPTLVLAAERDTVAPAAHAAALAQKLPNATLRSVAGAGHWALATHTDAFLDALLPWMD